jgi:hypothetical protein
LLEDQQGCGPAFRVLSRLASLWVADARQNLNLCADVLARNMYRWLSRPDAATHDPALLRAAQALTHKMLLQLVAELQRLGAAVVHADAGSVIVCTGKSTLSAAVG